MGNTHSSKEQAPFKEEEIICWDIVDPEGILLEKGKAIWKEFTTLRPISKGANAKVFLVKKNATGELFAMKTLKNENIRDRNQVTEAKKGGQVLAATDCPFIVKLFYAFQTPERLFLLTELMQGGELLFHLQHENKFSEDRSRFYSAEIVLALRYIHSKGIIHRDLKLENVLLDIRGHIKLADLGQSREGTGEGKKAFESCGVPEYLSPEILASKGHDFGADWWSLGIVLYEMLSGRPPFYSPNSAELNKNILEKEPEKLPCFSPEAWDLISKLLNKDSSKRLGANGPEEVMEHPFFKAVNWTKLHSLEVEPPFVPKVFGAEDLSNFDNQVAGQPRTTTVTKNILLEVEDDDEEEEAANGDFSYAPTAGTYF